MTTQRKADLLLVLITGFWGCSYYLSDLALGEMPPFSLCAMRFLLAFALLGIALFPKLRHINRKTLLWAVPGGAFPYPHLYRRHRGSAVYLHLQCWVYLLPAGGDHTPFDLFAVPEKAGAADAAVPGSLHGRPWAADPGERFSPGAGDLICLLCALGYGINLLVVEHAVRQPEVDALQLGVFQQLVTGAAMLVLSLLFETPCLPQTPTGWGASCFCPFSAPASPSPSPPCSKSTPPRSMWG